MSETQVDLSQIRGDFTFHMEYLTNAITQTLKRELQLWESLGQSEATIDELVKGQVRIWEELTGKSDVSGSIPAADDLVQAFIDISARTKPACDAFEETNELSGSLFHTDTPAEQFTEACRQIRTLCEDLIMMREQDPGHH